MLAWFSGYWMGVLVAALLVCFLPVTIYLMKQKVGHAAVAALVLIALDLGFVACIVRAGILASEGKTSATHIMWFGIILGLIWAFSWFGFLLNAAVVKSASLKQLEAIASIAKQQYARDHARRRRRAAHPPRPQPQPYQQSAAPMPQHPMQPQQAPQYHPQIGYYHPAPGQQPPAPHGSDHPARQPRRPRPR